MNEALSTAGPRYTPEINVELPIAFEFEAFGRTERFFDAIKAHAKGIRREIRSFGYTTSSGSSAEKETPDINASIAQIRALTEQLLIKLGEIRYQPVGKLAFIEIASQIEEILEVVEGFEQALDKHDQFPDSQNDDSRVTKRRSFYREKPFQTLRYQVLTLQRKLEELYTALEHADRVASGALILLTGDAGSGKTHLLCDIAGKRLQEGRPTVLLMGQRFVSHEEPWTQMLQQLDLRDLSGEEFIGALEAAAQAADCRALVMIDALNEGAGRRIWTTHLPAFYLTSSARLGLG